jgi:hypothetical protein
VALCVPYTVHQRRSQTYLLHTDILREFPIPTMRRTGMFLAIDVGPSSGRMLHTATPTKRRLFANDLSLGLKQL